MKNIDSLLDTLHLEDIHNKEHPSVFDDNEEYNMLIFRIPVVSDKLTSKSLGFIFTKYESYYFDSQKQTFELQEDIFISPYKIIDKAVDRLLRSFSKYNEKIADMELDLYEGNSGQMFLNSWLELKLEILRIERALTRTTNTMDEFIEFYDTDENFPINKYIDIHEHLERTMRSAALQLSKLDYLYNFYNAKSNDKMNRMIYILTVISAIFLPLNLVVGFFGMNTSSLPFTGGDGGTYYAISLMAIIMVITSSIVILWQKRV